MFPEQRYGRRLHALIAGFLGKGHARAHRPGGKSIVEHAVAVEVDFLSIARSRGSRTRRMDQAARPFQSAGLRDASPAPARGEPDPGVACGRA